MKAEQLKVIAEGMYPDHEVDIKHNVAVWLGRCAPVRYNPLTNNDQMVEIMEKLKLYTKFMNGQWYSVPNFPHNDVGKGKTINEAVCNAALEHFNE